MPDQLKTKIDALTPTQFENLTYECLSALGLVNLVWRTPGADGGRDLEGISFSRDIANFTTTQRWFVECKRYGTSINWPTVYEKLAYAESNSADILLISTNSNPSPQCETEITKWNATGRSPVIRIWRGYAISNMVRSLPHVATMFGLIDDATSKQSSLIPLASIVSKAADMAYNRAVFSAPDVRSAEVVASISELFALRLKDIDHFGAPVPSPRFRKDRLFDWAEIEGSLSEWEETSLRATVSFLAYEFGAARVRLTLNGERLAIELLDARPDCAEGIPLDRNVISFWARISIKLREDGNWELEQLPYVR